MNENMVADITARLSALFDATEVKFKPAVVTGGRALAMAYINARAVQDRLDDVVGVDGWQDEYEVLPCGSVVCRLRLRVAGEWVTKVDVGSQSEQPDDGDKMKAAFSDALKRAAVKFGVGRYLYRLPSQWCEYDAKTRRFTSTPTLPAWAQAGKAPAPKPAEPAKPAPSTNGTAKPSTNGKLPANGAELVRRLGEYEAKLVRGGVCERGALLRHVTERGVANGFGKDLTTWSGQAIQAAVDEARLFEAKKGKQ